MILITTTTFSSFWLSEASEKITMSITSLLALVTQANEARREFPAISYITEMDTFILFCLFISYVALIQCVSVEYMKGKPHLKKSGSVDPKVRNVKVAGHENIKQKIKKWFDNLTPLKLDVYSRIIFPAVLLTFTTTYFTMNAISSARR